MGWFAVPIVLLLAGIALLLAAFLIPGPATMTAFQSGGGVTSTDQGFSVYSSDESARSASLCHLGPRGGAQDTVLLQPQSTSRVTSDNASYYEIARTDDGLPAGTHTVTCVDSTGEMTNLYVGPRADHTANPLALGKVLGPILALLGLIGLALLWFLRRSPSPTSSTSGVQPVYGGYQTPPGYGGYEAPPAGSQPTYTRGAQASAPGYGQSGYASQPGYGQYTQPDQGPQDDGQAGTDATQQLGYGQQPQQGQRDWSQQGQRDWSEQGQRDWSQQGDRNWSQQGDRNWSQQGDRNWSQHGDRNWSQQYGGQRDWSQQYGSGQQPQQGEQPQPDQQAWPQQHDWGQQEEPGTDATNADAHTDPSPNTGAGTRDGGGGATAVTPRSDDGEHPPAGQP